MLEFNVAQLEKLPIGTTREYDLDERLNFEDNELSVKGIVVLTQTNRSILVKAELDTVMPQQCSRCLKQFECPQKVSFEEEFFPLLDVVSGQPVEADEDAGDFMIDEHHILDLTEAVRQYTILSLPMKPLCRTDCGGIGPDIAS